MKLSEFIDRLKQDNEVTPKRHVLSKPATAEQIAAFENKRPDFPLPDDYRKLLLISNGLKIATNDDTPTGRLQLLPITKVKPLLPHLMEMCGLGEEDMTDPPTSLLIGTDPDSQWGLGLDTDSGDFLEADYTGETTNLGQMQAFLDWAYERFVKEE